MKWIEATPKTLPKEDGKYLVTILENRYPTSSYDWCQEPTEREFVATMYFDEKQKIWNDREMMPINALISSEDSQVNSRCVIAWVEMPSPWQGENDKD